MQSPYFTATISVRKRTNDKAEDVRTKSAHESSSLYLKALEMISYTPS
jgi:hypothetical protein